MPMQPRPMAETSRLLLPSLRFCIFTTPILQLKAASLASPTPGSLLHKTLSAKKSRDSLLLFQDYYEPIYYLGVRMIVADVCTILQIRKIDNDESGARIDFDNLPGNRA